jgi:hypothetical protein
MPKLLVIDDYDSHKRNKKVSNQEQHGAIQKEKRMLLYHREPSNANNNI